MISVTKEPKVSIVIINWNGYEDTYECIESLMKITYKNLEIVVVDNGSDTDDVLDLENKFEKVKVLRNKENLGFSGGNNIGINYSLKQNSDFILLLNNDTTVNDNFLEPLVEKSLVTKDIGIIAPQINYYSNPKRIWSAGGKISKIRGSGFAFSNKLEIEHSNLLKEVTFVSGCCMLIKKEAFEKVGLFDEKYFLYTEDTDFCYRVNKTGLKIYITAESKIYHKVNKSTETTFSTLPLYYNTRNRLYFSKKNFKYFLPITFIYLSITMILKCIGWFITGKTSNISAVYRGFKDFLIGKMYHTNYLNFSDLNQA